MAMEEREMVQRMLAGDELAFELFSDSYLPALYRFASNRLGGDRELTREIVQMTVCKVFSNLASFRGEAALLTWMGSICRNEIAMHFRQQSRRPREVEWNPETEDLANQEEWVTTTDVEESLIQDERANLIHMVLDLLPTHYGQALEWKYVENLPVKEIAQRLQLSAKAAESLLTRARQSFQAQFDRHIEQLGLEEYQINSRRRRAVSES